MVSRIQISNFNKNFTLLLCKKGKLKRYKICSSITKMIINYIEKNETKSSFLFYGEIRDSKGKTRTNFIKNKISDIIKKCYYFYSS